MSRKRRQVVKKRKVLSAKDIQIRDRAILYNDVRKTANKVNERLKSLERGGFKTGTWASRKLVNRLDSRVLKAYNKKTGRVKISNDLSNAQLKAIKKSLKNFLESDTSTRSGINKVRNKTIESLRGTLSGEDHELSFDEAEALYDMLGDRDFNDLVEKIGASESWVILDEAVENNDSEMEFQVRMQTYLAGIEYDDDMYERISRIFNKYVS